MQEKHGSPSRHAAAAASPVGGAAGDQGPDWDLGPYYTGTQSAGYDQRVACPLPLSLLHCSPHSNPTSEGKGSSEAPLLTSYATSSGKWTVVTAVSMLLRSVKD